MRDLKFRATVLAAFLLLLCGSAAGQTYAPWQMESAAPLPWQVHYDPAGRLTVGNSDGNASASAHSTAWASVVRYGGADGQGGLLDDYVIPAAAAPALFGLARSGCVVQSAATLNQCMRVRWEPAFEGDSSSMLASLYYQNGTVVGFLEENVQPGDEFSIERMPDGVINFYRGTGTPDERRRVFSAASPFASDGGSGAVEVRAAFPPSGSTVKLTAGRELYYCHPSAGCL